MRPEPRYVQGPTVQDDQFGGPAPDDAHLSGVVLRLNDDGTTPARSNPFFRAGAASIGRRSWCATSRRYSPTVIATGLAWLSTLKREALWLQENGDDSFSEINRVNSRYERRLDPGNAGRQNGSRSSRRIETTFGGMTLQQLRWPPKI